ncbi:MAG: rod shape-determining protein MreD [Clostridiales bacterium]|nr:rod shape-determining protein MreD [Clostridiales bacterium]
MKYFRFLIYFVVIIINFIFQTTVFEAVSIMGIKPDTALIIVVSVAFIQGEFDGIVTGLFAGLLQDSFFSLYLGCHMFIYASIAFVCGCFFKGFYKESFFLPIALCAAADLYSSLVFYVLNMLLRGYFNILGFFTSVMLPEFVYTMLVSAFIYRLVYYVTEIINNRFGEQRRLF